MTQISDKDRETQAIQSMWSTADAQLSLVGEAEQMAQRIAEGDAQIASATNQEAHWNEVLKGIKLVYSLGGVLLPSVRNAYNLAESEIAQYTGEIAEENGKIQTHFLPQLQSFETQIEAFDPGFERFATALNGMLSAIGTLSKSGIGRASDGDMVENEIGQLMTAAQDQLEAQVDESVLNHGSSLGLSNDQLETIADQKIQLDGSEYSLIDQMQNNLISTVLAYNEVYDQAKVDAYSVNPVVKALFSGLSIQLRHDHSEEVNADAMKGLARGLMSSLEPLMNAQVSTIFASINSFLKGIFKKLEKILNDPNLSPEQKQEKVLSLVMYALGYLNLIQQEVETLKTENEKQMAKANTDASRMNLQDSKADASIMDEVQSMQKTLKIQSLITTIAMGALFTLMAPGIGTAIVVASFTVLSATGAVGDLTAAIAKKLEQDGLNKDKAQDLADGIVAGLQVVLTLGGGVALDQFLIRATQTMENVAVNSAMADVRENIENGVRKAVEMAERNGVANVDRAATKQLLEQIAELSARDAAHKMARQLLKQSIMKSVPELIGKDFQKMVARAAQKAATSAIQDAKYLAESASSGVAIAPMLMEQVASQGANSAVASLTSKTVSDIEQESRKSLFRILFRRVLASTVVSIGDTNMLVDSANEAQKEDGKKMDDKGFDALLASLKVIEQVMEMIALVAGGGMPSQVELEGGSTFKIVQRGMSGMQGASFLADTFASGSMAQIDEAEAKLTENQQVVEGLGSLLNVFLSQVQKGSSQGRSLAMERIAQEVRSLQDLSFRVFDGVSAGVEVLVSSAV